MWTKINETMVKCISIANQISKDSSRTMHKQIGMLLESFIDLGR
jgi:hypothetical protein